MRAGVRNLWGREASAQNFIHTSAPLESAAETWFGVKLSKSWRDTFNRWIADAQSRGGRADRKDLFTSMSVTQPFQINAQRKKHEVWRYRCAMLLCASGSKWLMYNCSTDCSETWWINLTKRGKRRHVHDPFSELNEMCIPPSDTLTYFCALLKVPKYDNFDAFVLWTIFGRL